jgi:hypothetical protein
MSTSVILRLKSRELLVTKRSAPTCTAVARWTAEEHRPDACELRGTDPVEQGRDPGTERMAGRRRIDEDVGAEGVHATVGSAGVAVGPELPDEGLRRFR